MALKEKIKFEMLVDPDDPYTIIFKPLDDLKDNMMYTLDIKNIKLEDDSNFSRKESFYTPLDYFYVPTKDVIDHISSIAPNEEEVIRHIIHAGKAALYYCKRKSKTIPNFTMETIKEDYYPFYMYIKNHAIVDVLKNYYIEKASGPKKWRDVLSDLEREEEMDFDGLRDLIKTWELEADTWLDLVVTITADPKWALRGKYCYSAYYTYSNPYHNIRWGKPPHNSSYDRGY